MNLEFSFEESSVKGVFRWEFESDLVSFINGFTFFKNVNDFSKSSINLILVFKESNV